MNVLRSTGHFLKAITTARDNQSPSLLRVVALCISVEFLIWAALAMYRGESFQPQLYAGGASALVLAIGSALRIALPANAGNDGWQQASDTTAVDNPDGGK